MSARSASIRRAQGAGAFALAILLAAAGVGCASQSDVDPTSSADNDPGALECELALVRLDGLIAARAEQSDFPAAILIEAREIYQMGRQLYLEREYELALRLIEEGIQLVE